MIDAFAGQARRIALLMFFLRPFPPPHASCPVRGVALRVDGPPVVFNMRCALRGPAAERSRGRERRTVARGRERRGERRRRGRRGRRGVPSDARRGTYTIDDMAQKDCPRSTTKRRRRITVLRGVRSASATRAGRSYEGLTVIRFLRTRSASSTRAGRSTCARCTACSRRRASTRASSCCCATCRARRTPSSA